MADWKVARTNVGMMRRLGISLLAQKSEALAGCIPITYFKVRMQ